MSLWNGEPGGGTPGGVRGAEAPRRLTLDERDVQELLALAGGEGLHAKPTRRGRKSARVPMNGALTSARVQHPGGGASHWEVSLIDLSDGGAGIIYPGFLHLGTQLVVTLVAWRGGPVAVAGRVTWCRLLRKQFHAVGVTWDKPIEARTFVPNEAWLASVSNGDATASRLTGRLIHLCENAVEHQLLKMHCSESELRVEWARDRGSLLDALRAGPCDVVVADADSMGEAGPEMMGAIRGERYLGPVIVASSPARGGVEALFIDDDVHPVAKPLTHDALMAAIRTGLHQSSDPLRGTAPIYTTINATPEKRRCIVEFLNSCRSMTRNLATLVASGDAKRILQICRSLSDTGAGYGYPLLSETAGQIVEALERGEPIQSLGAHVRGLVFLVNRLQVSHVAAA